MAADATSFMIMRCDNRPAALLSRIFGSAVMLCPSSCKTTANSHRLDGTGQTSASSAGSTHFPCADLVALWKSPAERLSSNPVQTRRGPATPLHHLASSGKLRRRSGDFRCRYTEKRDVSPGTPSETVKAKSLSLVTNQTISSRHYVARVAVTTAFNSIVVRAKQHEEAINRHVEGTFTRVPLRQRLPSFSADPWWRLPSRPAASSHG